MTTTTIALQKITVNEIIRRYPASIAVFNEHNIDGYCGGAVPLKDAAARDSVDLVTIVTALEKLIGAEI